MEKIIILGCIIAFFELLQWFIIGSVLNNTKRVRVAYFNQLINQNTSLLDIFTFIKTDLQQKAQTRELTEEEKNTFAKCHAMIGIIEKQFKDLGYSADVLR